MDPVNVTFGRALKIWWSFAWRAWVLMLLVMVPMEIVLFWYMMSHFPKQGAGNPAEAMRMAGTMMVLWPIFMAVLIALQVQAMRWMLNTVRWSDFRLALVPRE
jgi:hypothetical protein